MKKLLFGTTALAGAFAIAGAASAQEVNVGGALDITISGESQFEVEFAEEDLGFGSSGSDPDFVTVPDGVAGGDRIDVESGESRPGSRSWFFNQDHEIRFQADGVADASNLRYGVNLELELDTGGSSNGTNANWDEAWVYLGGSWGEVRLGDEDAVTDNLKISGAYANAGTGGLDGAQRTVGAIRHADGDEATKIIYYTPEIAGFQAGIDYAINGADRGSSAGSNTATNNHIDFGANWQGSFGGVDLGAYGGLSTFTTAKTATPDDETALNYSVGGEVGFAGFTLAAGFSQNDSDVFVAEGDVSYLINASLGAEFAGVNTSFAYQFNALRDSENQGNYILSADTGIAPGVSVQGDIAYITNFEGDEDADGVNAVVALEIAF